MSEQPCGCVHDEKLGIKLRACPAHDTRTTRIKISAEFQKLAEQLDRASCTATFGGSSGPLREAAETCARISKLMREP